MIRNIISLPKKKGRSSSSSFILLLQKQKEFFSLESAFRFSQASKRPKDQVNLSPLPQTTKLWWTKECWSFHLSLSLSLVVVLDIGSLLDLCLRELVLRDSTGSRTLSGLLCSFSRCFSLVVVLCCCLMLLSYVVCCWEKKRKRRLLIKGLLNKQTNKQNRQYRRARAWSCWRTSDNRYTGTSTR